MSSIPANVSSTLEAINAVKSLHAQGVITQEQMLMRLQSLANSEKANTADRVATAASTAPAAVDRDPPRVPKTPFAVGGPSADDLLALLATGKLSIDDYKAQAAATSDSVQYAVSAKGWLSFYPRGMRFPVNMPWSLASLLATEPGRSALAALLAKHDKHFSKK